MKAEIGEPQDKRIGLGWTSILLPLTLGFGLSLILAYQAYDAGREHRVAAQAAARDQSAFAAYLLASAVDRQMREALLYGFYPVDLGLGRSPDPLPTPAMLRVEPETSRCEPVYPDGRRFFRFEPTTGQVVVDGYRAHEIERWVLANLADGDTEPGIRHVVADLGSARTSLIVYRRWSDRFDHVVYGFESCWRTEQGNVFEQAAKETQAFSPALVGATPNDSLFVLAARTGDGTMAYGDRWTQPPAGDYSGSYYGTAAVGPPEGSGGLELRVTLLPQVAERLVEGGLPGSRFPLAVGLLALNGLLMWVAVRQLKKSHELVRVRQRFVRNVSHELRTPLQQMLLFTELLQSDRIEREGERAQALDILNAETRRLIGLVRNVLSFSGRSGEDLPLAEVDLLDVVNETVEAFRPLADSRQAHVKVVASTRPRVRANIDALKRVLINLLDNAVKYGPVGQQILVQVDHVEGADSEVGGQVSVSDDGPGVLPEERDLVWEAFRRLDRDEEGATAGSGIGLSIVRKLVEAMGGAVQVGEGPTSGATFTVRLPAVGTAS